MQVLFIGDDWPEDHHDLEIEDEGGRRLARARAPEGLEGITQLHALVAEHAPSCWAELPPEQAASNVVVGIETDRGPCVTALRAAGYQVFPINPLSAARYRQRHSPWGRRTTPVMRMFWPRSSAWTLMITVRWPGTVIWLMRSSCWRGRIYDIALYQRLPLEVRLRRTMDGAAPMKTAALAGQSLQQSQSGVGP